MSYDKALIAGKLRRWEKHLMRFRLPEWDEIPDFGLYMEQTVDLLRKYLDYLPPELKNEEVVTSSAINNYVRRGIMPGPIKKKYYRPHIACLLMICTLKQSLNMSMIKIALPTCECSADARCDECAKSPVGSAENSCTSGVRSAYESFISRHDLTAKYFVQQVRLASAALLDHDEKRGIFPTLTMKARCRFFQCWVGMQDCSTTLRRMYLSPERTVYPDFTLKTAILVQTPIRIAKGNIL